MIVVMNAQHNASSYAALSGSFDAYERLQYLYAFHNLAAPPNASNQTEFSSWLSALVASAKADNLNAAIYGNTLVLSDTQDSHAYIVSSLKNT